ncbi:hypothetical protein JTE90_023518 [Oedothorax gibbosus]|uniref:Elongin-C n=1 Tax=Oedothorax gibbosus TaxID=931172 RepID=A0AAV6VRR9_9ARAC|nr:hypothetical protein JTE90_023518 [Oedothorax gibbosus]
MSSEEEITMSDIKEETVYGSCEGPGSMYVKLISSDGHAFIIKREYIASSTICAMLSGCVQYTENETNEVNLRGISSRVLQRICQYFFYKVRYGSNRTAEVPDFPIESEILVDMLLASNFLKC